MRKLFLCCLAGALLRAPTVLAGERIDSASVTQIDSKRGAFKVGEREFWIQRYGSVVRSLRQDGHTRPAKFSDIQLGSKLRARIRGRLGWDYFFAESVLITKP
jgi:hypothetical protein